MTTEWIRDSEKFDTLTTVIRRTLIGGVLRRSDLDEETIGILESGIEDGLVQKDRVYICNECGKYYTLSDAPETCRCGTTITPSEIEPDVIQYYSEAYPEFIRSEVGDSFGEFDIIYDSADLEDVSPMDLEPSPSDDQYLHISPQYQLESGVHLFPHHNDVFLSWDRVGDLIDDREKVRDEISDFLSQLDDGRLLIEEEGLEPIDNNSGNGTVIDSSWYMKLHETTDKVAQKQSKARFGRNYNNQFERMGNEFLNTLFPHAQILQAGGGDQPDGYAIFEDRAYLIEAKCYSNDFKISSEQDKANRYVRRFSNYVDGEFSSDYNLTGYIFIAHEFNQKNFREDLKNFKQSNIEYVNLDVVCISDIMMAKTVEQVGELYRRSPSAQWRIYDESDHYASILNPLHELTGPRSIDKDQYWQLLDLVLELGEEESDAEREIRNKLEEESSLDEKISKSSLLS